MSDEIYSRNVIQSLIAMAASQLSHIDSLEKRINRDAIELAAQRRTIATLRARLRDRDADCDEFLAMSFNQYASLQRANLMKMYPWMSRRVIHAARIAAIRNFGALPGEPMMPMKWNDRRCNQADGR